jgi:hypothetical protein
MPDNLFKDKSAAVVLQSFLKAKEMEEKSRKELSNNRLAIYHDDWDSILETILQAQFIAANYKKIKLLKNTTQNILKKVTDDISIVYKVAPTRDYGDNEKVAEIYGYLNIDEFMMQANQYATLLNDIAIRPGWDNELKKITLDLQTPANTSVIQRDNYPQQAAAAYYDVEYIDSVFNTTKWNVFWSDFEHFLFDDRGNVKAPADNNPDMLNPYGKMPFVFVHMKPRPGMFWNPNSGKDLVDGTTITGVKRTMKDYLLKFQSFKQLWFRAQKGDVPPEQASDPASAFLLTGENSEVGVLDLTAQFEAMEQTLQADVNSFLTTYGLNVDMFAVSGEEASGKALNIKNRGLREIREKQLPIFRRVESELFSMIRLVWNTNNPGAKIPDTLEFKIDFAELETYIEPMEKRKQAQWDVQNGIMSPGQFYMTFNPNVVEEEEAETRMAENLLKYKNMKNQGFSFDQFFNQDQAGGEGNIVPPQPKQLTPGNMGGANLFSTKDNGK